MSENTSHESASYEGSQPEVETPTSAAAPPPPPASQPEPPQAPAAPYGSVPASGAPASGAPVGSASAGNAHVNVPPSGVPQKSPILAAFLSFLPGLGNVYNGLYLRAVTFFLIWASLLALASGMESEPQMPLFVLSVMFMWFFNVFDAYRQATLINHGFATDLGLTDRPQTSGNGALVPGVALIVIGFYGLLSEFFEVDLSWLIDLWPLGLIGFGGWLTWRSLQARKEQENGLY